MYQIDMNPARTLELGVEGVIRGLQKKLLGLSNKELGRLVIQSKGKYQKLGGDLAYAWMEIFDQSEEVYEGMAAGRILTERYGKDYVKDLWNGRLKFNFMYSSDVCCGEARGDDGRGLLGWLKGWVLGD